MQEGALSHGILTQYVLFSIFKSEHFFKNEDFKTNVNARAQLVEVGSRKFSYEYLSKL